MSVSDPQIQDHGFVLKFIVELGAWNLPRHQIYKTYVRAYQRHFPISEPTEDVDDRIVLYRL